MPIPRSPTAQVTWIPRRAEGDFAALLSSKQPRVIPLIGAGGAGKTSLLHRFMTHCTATKVPALSLDLTKLQTNSALEALMQATTQGTDAFDACRERLRDSYEAMSAILQSYGTHAGQAADLLQKTAGGEESFGLVVGTAVGAVKALGTFWQREENKRRRELLRTPEESLLRALAEDFAEGGALLIDTMEQAAQETLQTRLHSRDDGDLVTVHGDQSKPVAFTEYLARLAFFLFDKPVLMVIAGRPPALRELGGLPHAYFAPTMEVPPFTEPEIGEYVRRQLPQLPPAQPEDIHRLHTITLGNPFLLERVTRLMAEWQPAWRWEAAQWEPLIDSYRKDDRHGLLLFVTQRLLTHVLQDDTAFWRLALPRHSVHRDMADLLFPADEFPDTSGEERLKIYESKGLIYRGQEPAHFFLHDETRAALQAWAEHRKVWLDDRAAALHRALGDLFAQAAGWPASYPQPKARVESNTNPLLLEAAYHRVMANIDLDVLHRQDRNRFWQQLSGSISMTHAIKLRVVDALLAQPAPIIEIVLKSLADESAAWEKLFSASTKVWLQSRSQAGTLPLNWNSDIEFLQEAALAFPEDPMLLVLLACALQQKSPDEAETLFQQAIRIHPGELGIAVDYANFLFAIRRRNDEAEAIYMRILETDDMHAIALANYAALLSGNPLRQEEAEILYLRAIKIDPKNVTTLWSYASFLSKDPQRHDEAEKIYRRAIEADPNHVNALYSYAVLLSGNAQRHDEAEALYRRIIETDARHADAIGNYALLLSRHPWRHDEAEKLYQRAVEINPEHGKNLVNYAVFLSKNPQRHDDAEALYRRAIEANPHHGNSLVGYGYFLSAGRQRHDEAEPYFRRAIEIENPTAFSLFLCAEFLSDTRRCDDEAESLYLRAMERDPSDAAIAGSAAMFLHIRRKDHPRAEAAYRQTLALAPREPNCLGNLAQLVLARGEREEGRALIDRAFAAKPPPPLQLELWFYRYAHFPREYPEAEATIEALLAEGVRSPGWDVSITLAQAAREGHPDPARLEALAVRLASDPPHAAGEAADAR